MNRSYAKTAGAMPFVTNGNAATPRVPNMQCFWHCGQRGDRAHAVGVDNMPRIGRPFCIKYEHLMQNPHVFSSKTGDNTAAAAYDTGAMCL